jgi:hypothetical protein
MTKKEMKQLRRIIELIASKREAAGLNFKEESYGIKNSVNYLYVWCSNSAYRHELNAMMMAIDGFAFCSCYQRVDNENNVVWEVV